MEEMLLSFFGVNASPDEGPPVFKGRHKSTLTRLWPNGVSMLGQNHRHCPIIQPALGCVQFHANMRCSPTVGLMLVQRRRRWTNINPHFACLLMLDGMLANTGGSFVSVVMHSLEVTGSNLDRFGCLSLRFCIALRCIYCNSAPDCSNIRSVQYCLWYRAV